MINFAITGLKLEIEFCGGDDLGLNLNIYDPRMNLYISTICSCIVREVKPNAIMHAVTY